MSFEPIAIDDPDDARLTDYIGLTDPDIRRRHASERFFIAEGVEVVRRLIASDITRRSIVIAPNRLDVLRDVLDDAQCPVYIAERSIISTIAGFDLHRGVVASGVRPESSTLTDVMARTPRWGRNHRIAVLHGVGDHENLGAIVRSARAFHVDALALDPTCADPFYRRSVRVSMGEIFFLPVIPIPVKDLIVDVRDLGGTSIAFTPRPDAVTIDDVEVGPGPLAMIFGSEGFGLPDELIDAADIRARIPIASDVDSLNVGHAAAVAFAAMSRV